MSKLKVDSENLKRNLEMQKGMIVAEPLYIILAALGHPDAHEKVRTLTLMAERTQVPLEQVMTRDDELKPYLGRMSEMQRAILKDPMLYTGIAARKARKVAENWSKKLQLD